MHDGFIAGTAAAAGGRRCAGGAFRRRPPRRPPTPLEVTFSADASVHDGRFANNPWLQELPKPLNKVTWDNVIVMSPRTAERLGIAAQKMTKYQATVATVTLDGRSVTGPVWVQAGHPDNSVNLQLGYGRTRAGRVGTGIGYNANLVRRSTAPWFADRRAGAGDRRHLHRRQHADALQHGAARGRPHRARSRCTRPSRRLPST